MRRDDFYDFYENTIKRHANFFFAYRTADIKLLLFKLLLVISKPCISLCGFFRFFLHIKCKKTIGV